MKVCNLKKTSCNLLSETTIFMTRKVRTTYHDLNTFTYISPRTSGTGYKRTSGTGYKML